jgi:hypothetical protein
LTYEKNTVRTTTATAIDKPEKVKKAGTGRGGDRQS